MSKYWKRKLLAAVGISAACLAAWALLRAPAEPLLSQEQVIEQIRLLYDGKVTSAQLKQSIYNIKLQSELGLYELELDARDGSVRAIHRMAVYEPPVAEPGTPSAPSGEEQPPILPGEESGLSEAEAAERALQQVQGIVEEIEYKQHGESRYYLVEVDTNKGEAVVQIHAITGAVMSITWDEEEEDEERD